MFVLTVRPPDVVAMQCRQPSLEGTVEIKLRQLVKEALRMRPRGSSWRRLVSALVIVTRATFRFNV